MERVVGFLEEIVQEIETIFDEQERSAKTDRQLRKPSQSPSKLGKETAEDTRSTRRKSSPTRCCACVSGIVSNGDGETSAS